ncbi:MAG: hypothetical protein H7228_16775 [Polaromonas sp.]|nr:hypothetical protein [Polaromonas sp.]
MIRPNSSRMPPPNSLELGDVTLLTAQCIMQQLTQRDEATGADAPQVQTHNRRSEDRRADQGATASHDALHNERKGLKQLRAPDIPVDDWDHLFRAVETRLKSTVEDLIAKSENGPQLEMVTSAHAVVFERRAGLDYLHAALTHERDMKQQFEFTVFSAQSELAQALSLLGDIKMQEGHKPTYCRTETVASIDTRSQHKTIFYVPLYDALIAAKARRRALARVPDIGATGGEALRH